MTYHDELIFYDVSKGEVSFVRGIETPNDMKVSDTYISFKYENSIQILDHNGRSVHEIMTTEPIVSYDINRAGKLVYNTSKGEIVTYDGTFASSTSQKFGIKTPVSLEETGAFIGTTQGRLYDTASGKRIYINMKSGMVDFNEDTTRLFTIGDGPIKVYNALNLKKRIASIQIHSSANSLVEGTGIIPSIIATGKDGSQTKVNEQVVWRTSNSQIAYFSQGKLIAKTPGRVTLKATYEDHEATLELTVKKDPRPSDIDWLKQQKQALEKKKTFLYAPYRLNSDYNKIKGVAGKFKLDRDEILRGKYKDNWLYGTYLGKKKVDEMLLFLDYEKRDITSDEMRKVFGKPIWDLPFEDVKSQLIRGTKTIKQSEISRVTLHAISKKQALYVFYDLEGRATYFYFAESLSSG